LNSRTLIDRVRDNLHTPTTERNEVFDPYFECVYFGGLNVYLATDKRSVRDYLPQILTPN